MSKAQQSGTNYWVMTASLILNTSKIKSKYFRDNCISLVIEALIIIARQRTNYMSNNLETNKDNAVDPHGIYFSHRKKWKCVICRKMDLTRDVKQIRSQIQEDKHSMVLLIFDF